MKPIQFVIFLLVFLAMESCQNDPKSSDTSEQTTDPDVNTPEQKTETDYTGIFTKGSDYQEFKDCNSWKLYAFAAHDNLLSSKYDSMGMAKGDPMFVRFEGETVSDDSTETQLQQIIVHKIVEITKYQGQPLCRPPKEIVFTFRGNEPFWALTISADSLIFNHFEHTPQVFPYSSPQWQDSVWVFKSEHENQNLTARVSEGECYDSMSGMRYAMHVEVQTPIGTFEGCGEVEGRNRPHE